MLREDEFADDLLRAFEVALKEYAAGDEKLAYQLCSPFGPYLATRVPKVAAPAARASSGGARASKGGALNAAPKPAPRAEDDESDGEDGETAEVNGRAKRAAKPPPAPPKHSETRALDEKDEKKKRRSGPSGVSGARKAARAAAEVTAAAAEAAAAGQALPPPPGPRTVETALRTENGELKLQLAKVSEERMALKEQLATLKATVELREQLAIATAKAACGGMMLRAMTSLGGGCARAGSSGVQTPGQDTPVGSSTQQQLAFDSFFGA